MRKIKQLILIILMVMCPLVVNAESKVTITPNNLSVKKGETAKFNIIMEKAVGRVDIVSSDPKIASISNSSIWLENNTETITVTGKNAGEVIITIKCSDVATFEDNITPTPLTGEYQVKVTVTGTETTKPNKENPETGIGYSIAIIGAIAIITTGGLIYLKKKNYFNKI